MPAASRPPFDFGAEVVAIHREWVRQREQVEVNLERLRLPPTYHDVAPILAERRLLCHNGLAVPLGLRLDSFEVCPRGQFARPGSQRR
jgi:hypothetical protein